MRENLLRTAPLMAGIPGLEGIVWLASFARKKRCITRKVDQTQLNWMMLLASNTGKGQEAAVMTAMVVATTMAVLRGGKDDQHSRRGCGRLWQP
ncbi:hypothetical protein Pyn_27239 [Prunus yedoensis var. nudiflora]|uniref:Uncharacterized protein n=1 Tax=Prunus yedoensis var. nudiflora TaxID=2094558 RepID=A0A314XSE3_PRUYE|nr:hypothetical protein Pyn_27239 [Prunus yedoensis var. nudiflora]